MTLAFETSALANYYQDSTQTTALFNLKLWSFEQTVASLHD